MELTKEVIGELMEKAAGMLQFSYIPYSHYAVGAALLTKGGRIYTGCNIENAAFTPTNCAERTAFFKAVSEGEREYAAIAIVGGKNRLAEGNCTPCGVCRQVMEEFCDPETFQIILGTGPENCRIWKLKELLPGGFGPGNVLPG